MLIGCSSHAIFTLYFMQFLVTASDDGVLNNDGNPFTASGATALGEYVLTMNFYPRINVNNSMI